MAVNLQQGLPGIVADILSEARGPLTTQEIADELDRLGVAHARPSTLMAAQGALNRRKRKVGDVKPVARGLWQKTMHPEG